MIRPRRHPHQPGFKYFYRNTMPGFDASYSLKRNDLVVLGFDLDDPCNTFTLLGIDDQLTPEERAEIAEIETLHGGSFFSH